MPKNVIITEMEKKALEDYQDNYYKIINTLLRKGITSEQTINSKKGKDYAPPSDEDLNKAFENIKHIYSAIIKSTMEKENSIEDKPLYRGTQLSLIEQMRENGEETSFLSTTTNKNQTRAFSRTFSKDKSVNTEFDKAFLKVEGNVPHINLEELLGGMEDEVIFAPAKAEIIEGIDGIPNDENHTKMYGKPYTLKLTPLDIPEMTNEDISILKDSIMERNQRMGKTIDVILKAQQSPEEFDISNLTSLIQQYSIWKDDIITYCHQQFRIIQKELGFENSKDNNKGQEENKALDMQQNQTVDTQQLGKETIDEQRDTQSKDAVETQMEEQIRTNGKKQQAQQYKEQPETKNHTTENPESFRSKMKFEMTPDQYQEVLDRHAKAEENFAKEMTENTEKKKAEQAENGVR